MATTKAKTVTEYLQELDPERRAVIARVRKVVKDNLPKGYADGVGYGMISWHIPLSTFPDTYNGQPLGYAALAAQTRYNTLYLMGAYANPKQRAFLRDEFQKRGMKFDMGKSCLRFKTIDDLPLDVIGKVIKSTSHNTLIAVHEAAHSKK